MHYILNLITIVWVKERKTKLSTWSKAHLEKLVIPQIFNKCCTIFRTQSVITYRQESFTSPYPEPDIPIQSIFVHPSSFRFISIFPFKTLHGFLFSLHIPHAAPCHHHRYYLVRTTDHQGTHFAVFPTSSYFLCLLSKYPFQHPFLDHLQPVIFPECQRQRFTPIFM